jgi:glycosyltransferase involved in cell wall biosynthesis
MKILHLAAGNRWTGAAAPAFTEVEALRGAGVEAHYAYVGGYKLQAKIGSIEFAHPIIEKAQNPLGFARSVAAIRRLIREIGIDVLHAHLTYDHALSRFAARMSPIRIARTYHSRRAIRSDLLSSSMVRRSNFIFVVNETFTQHPVLRGRKVIYTPPPLDDRMFVPRGPDLRAHYSIPPQSRVLCVIGKVSAGRGFEEALQTLAIVRRSEPDTRLMIIGHGEHRMRLEHYSRELGVSAAVIWAGYHEEDLPEHYRSADALLFTAAGSDEGHRAVIEALGCGLPPAVFPIPGVEAILGPLAPRLAAAAATPEALAEVVLGIFRAAGNELSTAAAERSRAFNLDSAARRLLAAYSP